MAFTDEQLNSLNTALYKRYGLDFSCYEPNSLKRRIDRSIKVLKLESIHELWVKILREKDFVYQFLDEISVGLTAMFRDPILWRRLNYHLESSYQDISRLKVWHAGCSTGEEVYTMGIVLKELQMLHKAERLATDISGRAMEAAQKGHYHQLKMDEYSRNYREYNPGGTLKKYYTVHGPETVVMNTELVEQVSFQHHNLIRDGINEKFNIIFCRNVMIYFDAASKQKVMDLFYKSLHPGGMVIFGFYDAVIPILDKTRFLMLDNDAKIFRKV